MAGCLTYQNNKAYMDVRFVTVGALYSDSPHQQNVF